MPPEYIFRSPDDIEDLEPVETPTHPEGKAEKVDFLTNLREQYETQKNGLVQTGIVDGKTMTMKGVDGRNYPIPTLQEIAAKMMNDPTKKKMYEKKIQEFTVDGRLPRLLLVPLKYPLGKREEHMKKDSNGKDIESFTYSGLMKVYTDTLRTSAAAGKLQKKDGTLFTSTNLTENEPLWLSDTFYNDADERGELLYRPHFDETSKTFSGGYEKKDIPDSSLSFPGWEVMLVEDMTDVPKAGEGRLEGGKTVAEYLSYFEQNKEESAMTIEGWLWMAISRLREDGVVLDDKTYSYLLGAIFHKSGMVPGAYFNSGNVRAGLRRYSLDYQSDRYAPRRSVMISSS